MPDDNTYDDKPIPIEAILTGTTIGYNRAQFFFTITKQDTSTAQSNKTGTIEGFPKTAKCEFGPVAVASTDDYYDLDYYVEVSKSGRDAQTVHGTTIRVWPKRVNIAFTSDSEIHKKVPFVIKDKAGTNKLANQKADNSGKWKGLIGMKEYSIDVEPPYEIEDRTVDQGRKRKYKVRKAAFTAVFCALDQTEQTNQSLRQYVNMTAGSDTWSKDAPRGDTIVLEVASQDDEAEVGDIVHVEVRFNRASDRTRPEPRLLRTGLEGGTHQRESARKFKGQVKLDGSKKGKIKVCVGIAGGDVCTIKLGSTSACSDAQLVLTNWRVINYDLAQPSSTGGDKLTEFTLTGGDGLPGGMTTAIEGSLDNVFVEFKPKTQFYFDLSDLPEKFRRNCMDRGYFDGGGNGTVLVLAHEDLLTHIFKKKMVWNNPKTVRMTMADYTVSMAKWRQTIEVYKEKRFRPNGGDKAFPYVLSDEVLNANRGEFAHGDFAIKKVSWRAIKYIPVGQSKTTRSGDWSNNWRDITTNTDPGYGLSGEFTDETDIRRMVEFPNWRYLQLRFPNRVGYPGVIAQGGRLQQIKLGTTYEILIEITFEGVVGESYLGSASRGDMVIRTDAGRTSAQSIASTIVHELGHNMGQTYYRRDASHDIPGMPPPGGVPARYYYTRHGHQGPHCARGLNYAKRQDTDFRGYTRDATCVMFGEGATNMDFCDKCTPYVKAEKLDDIRKAW
ncbi:MAG: hypothetical protein AAGF11_18525 [Myxococcota bacterium]